MPYYNHSAIMGHLARDPELKYTTSGTAVAKTAVAISDNYGEQKKTYFISVEVWGKSAENFSKWCSKGDTILIDGKLVQNTWEDKDGNRRERISIASMRFEKIKSPGKKDETAHDNKHGNLEDENDIPF